MPARSPSPRTGWPADAPGRGPAARKARNRAGQSEPALRAEGACFRRSRAAAFVQVTSSALGISIPTARLRNRPGGLELPQARRVDPDAAAGHASLSASHAVAQFPRTEQKEIEGRQQGRHSGGDLVEKEDDRDHPRPILSARHDPACAWTASSAADTTPPPVPFEFQRRQIIRQVESGGRSRSRRASTGGES